jgi:hypothetical protein
MLFIIVTDLAIQHAHSIRLVKFFERTSDRIAATLAFGLNPAEIFALPIQIVGNRFLAFEALKFGINCQEGNAIFPQLGRYATCALTGMALDQNSISKLTCESDDRLNSCFFCFHFDCILPYSPAKNYFKIPPPALSLPLPELKLRQHDRRRIRPTPLRLIFGGNSFGGWFLAPKKIKQAHAG